MIFEAFLGPKYIQKTCFLHVFCYVFSTWTANCSSVMKIYLPIQVHVQNIVEKEGFCKEFWVKNTRKMTISACFFVPICIQSHHFCCVFCYVFSIEKVHRDETLTHPTNIDFAQKKIGVKKCVCLCSWRSLTSQRYGDTYVFLMIFCDETCLILKK